MKPHDLGGAPIDESLAWSDSEPPFHAEWERRVFALVLAMGATGSWNVDQSRHARERMPEESYRAASYYQIWHHGLLRLLDEHGLLSAPEIAQRRAFPARPVARVLAAERVAASVARGRPTARTGDYPAPRFAVGAWVRVRADWPHGGHTRLPGYLLGRSGTVVRCHGHHVYPDDHAAGNGENPQPLYGVRFAAAALWPEAGPTDTVHADLWEPYLVPAHAT